jgi:hypothetical protein
MRKESEQAGALHTSCIEIAHVFALPQGYSLQNLMQCSEGNAHLAHFISMSTFHLQSTDIWQL